MWALLMHSTHPQRLKRTFIFLNSLSEPTLLLTFNGWPLRSVCTFVTPCVYLTIISRLWHSEGRAGQRQHVNIWASVFWAREMFSLPSLPIWRSFAGISPSSLKYLTGDLLCVVTVWWKVKWSCFFFSEEQMPSFMFLKDYRHQGWVTGPQSARGRKKKESKAGSVPVGFWWYVWLQICSGISSTKAHSLLMQLLHYQLILCRWALCQNIVFRPLDLILVLSFGESTPKTTDNGQLTVS